MCRIGKVVSESLEKRREEEEEIKLGEVLVIGKFFSFFLVYFPFLFGLLCGLRV